MFTGIVEEIGRIKEVRETGGGRELNIAADRVLEDLKTEDSIAVGGVCLTVTQVEPSGFRVQAVSETLGKSVLGRLSRGARVNLERALRLDSRLGGHLVQGHVDCAARLERVLPAEPGVEWEIAYPEEYDRYAARTGSICLDGVSLTIAGPGKAGGGRGRARVALIPYTLRATTLGERRPGDMLNIEFDCLAKYLERLLQAEPGEGLTFGRLKELGF